MSEFDGINPEDIAELRARAEKIVEDANTYYEVSLMVSHDGAVEFMDMYDDACRGNMSSLLELMGIIHILARSLTIAMDDTQ
jgi:hypothetical protein